jgi:hypothetical protein
MTTLEIIGLFVIVIMALTSVVCIGAYLFLGGKGGKDDDDDYSGYGF